MPELTRRRDPDLPDTWRILADGVGIGSIGRRHRHFKSPSWIWSIRLAAISRAGAPHTFEAARGDFETGWKAVSPTRIAADLAAARIEKAFTLWKYTMWDRGMKMPTQLPSGISRCFCAAEISISSMDGHVRAAHMVRNESPGIESDDADWIRELAGQQVRDGRLNVRCVDVGFPLGLAFTAEIVQDNVDISIVAIGYDRGGPIGSTHN